MWAYKEVAKILKRKNGVALTGAGISTAAGIPDFRGEKGIYSEPNIDLGKVFFIDYFLQDASYFYKFAWDFFPLLINSEPTKAHKFLAYLEKEGCIKATITQNVDSLHQKAGSQNVIEIHGNFRTFICLDCHKEFSLSQTIKQKEKIVPRCSCGGVLKPEVVFFGESLHDFDKARKSVSEASFMLVFGSSLTVSPANFLPRILPYNSPLVIVNLQQTPFDREADFVFHEDLEEFVSKVNKHSG